MIPYVRQFDFTYGRRDQVSPLIQRVIADNPGPFTFTGTGTYIVGRDMPGDGVAGIDPGPVWRVPCNGRIFRDNLCSPLNGRTGCGC